LRILFLSQRVPYPPNRGDKITTWQLIERMARLHEVTVACFAHDDQELEDAKALGEKGFDVLAMPIDMRRRKFAALPRLLGNHSLTEGVFDSRELRDAIDKVVGDHDVAYAYSSSMGAYLVKHDIPWTMHFAELDSDKWKQYAEKKRFPASWVYKREWRTLETYETMLAARTHQNVFCTPLEEAIFQERIPGRPSMVIRNGVDLSQYQPAPEAAEPGHLVFTGVMDYYPNVDGCQHFVKEVLPRVRSEFPDATFSIVGSRPNDAVKKLADTPGVTVTGFVDSTADWMRRAQIAVAPLRVARGIQNKVLEAMAMGLPVVGTTCATQGVGAQHSIHYVVADDPREQSAAIRQMMRDPSIGQKIGAAARKHVEANYDWDRALDPLDTLLDQMSALRA
jgi:polysaccharide biosynthesis protein PslH